MVRVGLVDYGSGNYRSVFNALDYLKVDFSEIRDPAGLKDVTHIILPGVGAFSATLRQLERQGFIQALREEVLQSGKFFLGICVGMQILATLGTEFEETPGLDFIPGKVVKIKTCNQRLPIPQIGWNEVIVHQESPLFRDIESEAAFYFVHSFHFVPDSEEYLVSSCQYGCRVTASVERDHIFGVQFHPEKSQLNGLQLLKNFVILDD